VVRSRCLQGYIRVKSTRGFLAGDASVAHIDARAALSVDLGAFVADHYPRLVRMAGSITRDVDAAEDAVQTALERAWRHRASLRDPSRMRAWLDQIVVRESVRAAARRSGLIARWFGAPRVEEIELAQRDAEAADLVALRTAYGSLTPVQRAVVALHLVAGYSVEDTAHMLGIPVNTVRSRLRAARRMMRELIAEAES
jgi:RNA polymerase sigma-70 factor (ECF subfamily)